MLQEAEEVALHYPDQLRLVPEEHDLLILRRVGLPALHGAAVGVGAVGVAAAGEIRPVIAHLPGQVVVLAGEGPPAFRQGLEGKPQVRGMEGPRIVPAGDLRVEAVEIHLVLRLPGVVVQPEHIAHLKVVVGGVFLDLAQGDGAASRGGQVFLRDVGEFPLHIGFQLLEGGHLRAEEELVPRVADDEVGLVLLSTEDDVGRGVGQEGVAYDAAPLEAPLAHGYVPNGLCIQLPRLRQGLHPQLFKELHALLLRFA